MYIVKRIEKDKVNRFSKFKLDVRKGFSVEYPFIKKLPRNRFIKIVQLHLGVKLLNQRKNDL